MELTVQQISYLLETASRSPFTAEEIACLIKRAKDQNQAVVPTPRLPTVSELFSKENIERFTKNKSLMTRVLHIIDRSLSGMEDVCIDEICINPHIPPIHRWKNCGKQSQCIIRSMFKNYGCIIK